MTVGKWIRLLGLGLVLALTLGSVVDAAVLQLPGPPAGADDPERGQLAFTISCAFCHGIDARGGETGPDLVRSEMLLNDDGGDLLGPFLRVGRPDLGMPPFQLSDSEDSDLAAFVRTETRGVIDRRFYEIQNVATGDADRGRAYFNGDGGCSGCHSPTGDLSGVANRYNAPDLFSRFVYPGRGGRGRPPVVREVTVTLNNGQSVEGTLEYIDDFNVGLREANGDYRSFSTTEADVEVRDPLEAHRDLLARYTDDDLHDLITYLVTLQ